jgi:hypothetical protein
MVYYIRVLKLTVSVLLCWRFFIIVSGRRNKESVLADVCAPEFREMFCFVMRAQKNKSRSWRVVKVRVIKRVSFLDLPRA